MAELNKKDIEVIARGRFGRRHIRHFIGSFAGWIAVTMGVTFATQGAPLATRVLAFVFLFAIAGVGAVIWLRAENKEVNAFVIECESNPLLPYVSEPGEEKKHEQNTVH